MFFTGPRLNCQTKGNPSSGKNNEFIHPLCQADRRSLGLFLRVNNLAKYLCTELLFYLLCKSQSFIIIICILWDHYNTALTFRQLTMELTIEIFIYKTRNKMQKIRWIISESFGKYQHIKIANIGIAAREFWGKVSVIYCKANFLCIIVLSLLSITHLHHSLLLTFHLK